MYACTQQFVNLKHGVQLEVVPLSRHDLLFISFTPLHNVEQPEHFGSNNYFTSKIGKKYQLLHALQLLSNFGGSSPGNENLIQVEFNAQKLKTRWLI